MGLLQRGRGGSSIYEFFGWEKNVKIATWWKISAKHKEQISQVNDFSVFSMYGKMQESGVIEISP